MGTEDSGEFEGSHGTHFESAGDAVTISHLGHALPEYREEEITVPAADVMEWVAERMRAHQISALQAPDAPGSPRYRTGKIERLRVASAGELLGFVVPAPAAAPQPPVRARRDAVAEEMYTAAAGYARSYGGGDIQPPTWTNLTGSERALWFAPAFDLLARLRSLPTVAPLDAFEVQDGETWVIYFATSPADALRHHEVYVAAWDSASDDEVMVTRLPRETPMEDGKGEQRTIGEMLDADPTPGFVTAGVDNAVQRGT